MRNGLVQIKEATGSVELGVFAKALDHYRLLPDWWLDYPEMAIAAHNTRIYFIVGRREKLIGYVWIDGYLRGHGCDIGILIEKSERKKWVPGDLKWFRELFSFIFTQLDVPRIGVSFETHRRSAERFFKALGFQYEGSQRCGTKIRGKYKRTILLGLTRTEFMANIGEDNHAVALAASSSEISGRWVGGKPCRKSNERRELVSVELPISRDGDGLGDRGRCEATDPVLAGTVR